MTDTFLLTMQYEERLCLPVFLAHYSRFIPAERTFIIDHGSRSDIVPPGYNTIRVPRARPYSESSRVQLIKHVSAGLLGYLSPDLCKPAIFSITPNWVMGFHGSDHPPTGLMRPMAHIRFAFGDRSAMRLRERIAVHRAMHAQERADGIAAQWRDGDTEFKAFSRFIERRLNAGTSIRTFAPVDCTGMFREIAVPQAGQPDQLLYLPNGFSPLQDCFIDLTERFPALAAAGDGP